ncbi:ABC transporter substrate-binding protein [Paenibacillus sp. 481]|uniref:ABC transporter substrate-binding protein n=1 Tax=Paenibacillus sp. 481 TaxID=2835869 RepID=UPI001E5082E6|nr:ABC transporter substrate-binding protein [Paenibacillus sp. 481]UHA74268.1 ABC transporter substrate-binding protein [Paenibacillus sp. 481]
MNSKVNGTTRFNMLVMMMSLLLLFATACGTGGNQAGGNSPGSNSGESDKAGNGSAGGQAQSSKVHIGIAQIVEHPSLDEARLGFIKALKDSGYTEGENLEIDYQNAQNEQANAVMIAQKFATDDKQLVLAIGTSLAQAAAKEIKSAPVLFTAITDPLGAGLVQSLEAPGANVTGTSDLHPEAVSKLMEFVAKHVKDVKTVGILANEGEQNTVTNVNQAVTALEKLGIEVKKVPVTNTSEVKQAAESLVGKVQAIYVPSDNTVVSALNTVVAVANDNKIPLFVAEIDSVKKGGMASFGFSYFELGYKTGKMAVDILKNGKKPADIPVQYADTLDLGLNLKAAAAQGFVVTDELKAQIKPDHLFE